MFDECALEVVLCHNAQTIGCALALVHIFARTVQVLQCYRKVGCDIAERVAKHILATSILIIREVTIALVKSYFGVSSSCPQAARDYVYLTSNLPSPHRQCLHFGRIRWIVSKVVR